MPRREASVLHLLSLHLWFPSQGRACSEAEKKSPPAEEGGRCRRKSRCAVKAAPGSALPTTGSSPLPPASCQFHGDYGSHLQTLRLEIKYVKLLLWCQFF